MFAAVLLLFYVRSRDESKRIHTFVVASVLELSLISTERMLYVKQLLFFTEKWEKLLKVIVL